MQILHLWKNILKKKVLFSKEFPLFIQYLWYFNNWKILYVCPLNTVKLFV